MKTGLFTMTRPIDAPRMADARRISGEKAQWVIDDRLEWLLYCLRAEVGNEIGPSLDRGTSKVTHQPPAIVFYPQTEVVTNEDGSVEVKAYAIILHSNVYDCPVGGYAAIQAPKHDKRYSLPIYEGEPGVMKVIIRHFDVEMFPVKDADGNQCFGWRRTECTHC